MINNDEKFLVHKIRAQYIQRQPDGAAQLKALDSKVKRPAAVFAYLLGSIGAIVMGSGMSLVMTDIGAVLGMAAPLVPGIVIGAVGLAAVCLNYPLYRRILAARRRRYASQVLALSEQLLGKE